MKFITAAIVLLAVAMGVQSSLIAGVPGLGLGVGINGLGLGGHDLGLGGHGLGLGLGGHSLDLGGHGLGLGLGGHGLGLNAINGLGLGVNSLGLGLNGHGHGHGLGVAVGVPGQSLSQGPALLGAPLLASVAHIPAAVNVAAIPHAGISVAHQAAIAPAGLGATYVAKNRGAVHTAPLAGHIKSAASINVAPAPGTW